MLLLAVGWYHIPGPGGLKPGFLDAKKTAAKGRQWEIAVMLKENALQLLGTEWHGGIVNKKKRQKLMVSKGVFPRKLLGYLKILPLLSLLHVFLGETSIFGVTSITTFELGIPGSEYGMMCIAGSLKPNWIVRYLVNGFLYLLWGTYALPRCPIFWCDPMLLAFDP